MVLNRAPMQAFAGTPSARSAGMVNAKTRQIGNGVRVGSNWAVFFHQPPALILTCRRKPAMAINGRRNKPFGPGGSTRRLHPSPAEDGFRRGRTRIDEGVKGVLLPGMGQTLLALSIVANDNYAPVAQAA